jgi:hypothetical protein
MEGSKFEECLKVKVMLVSYIYDHYVEFLGYVYLTVHVTEVCMRY